MRLLARIPYDLVFSTVYFGLRINICFAFACMPLLLALAMTEAPLRAWPFFIALAGAVCGPAIAAAFAVIEAQPERVFRAYWEAYLVLFRRSLAITLVAAMSVIMLGVDFKLALGTSYGFATPMLLILAALVVAVTTALLAGRPRLGLKSLLAYAYLTLRNWYLSLANLAVLGLLAVAVLNKPAVGLFLLPAPALYIVWANARHLAPEPGAGRL